MIIVRVAQGFSAHFPVRLAEWMFTLVMLKIGLTLYDPPDIFPLSQAYAPLAAIASERTWGLVCIGLGLARLAALIVNGAASHTRYKLWSPYVRGVTAFLACAIWFLLVVGFARFERPLLLFDMVLCFLIFEMVNVARAFGDAGKLQAGG